MVKIFVDTNFLFGPYQNNDIPYESFFKDMRKAKEKLIITDQLIDEFYRNRDGILKKQINEVKSKFEPNFHSTPLIKELNSYKELSLLKKQFKPLKEEIIKDLENILENPEEDKILKEFKDTYTNKKIIILSRNDEIIKKAFNRKLIGNPPISKDKNTIGDEIHWELLLDNIKDDLIIVSFDGTFERDSSFLIDEFKRKSGKKLRVFTKLSDALKEIGKSASKETKDFETTYYKNLKTLTEAYRDYQKCQSDLSEVAKLYKTLYINCDTPLLSESLKDIIPPVYATDSEYFKEYTDEIENTNKDNKNEGNFE